MIGQISALSWHVVGGMTRRRRAHYRLMRCQPYLDSLTRIPGLAALLCCSIRAFGVAPSDVQLTLAVTKSPAFYHLGERIVCELSFSTSKRGKYGIDNSGQSRGSWGAGAETFIATPPNGTAGPHVDPSRQLGFAVIGSILSSYDGLSSVPHVVRTDLNEWLRFVSPGVYRLQARSSRVSLFHKRPSPLAANEVVVNSNEIEVTVLPADPAWIAGEVSDIGKILDSLESNAEQKTSAASRLRYLNTESATAEMVRELPGTEDEPCHYALYEGLIESSSRKIAIGMLRQTLHSPATRVSWDAVDLLTMLTLLDEYQDRPIPPYNTKDPEQLKALQAAVKERRDRSSAVSAKYTAELKASLPQSSGRALTDAIFALWKEQELRFQNAPADSLMAMRREIVSIAGDLTLDQQAWLLSIYWKRLPSRPSLLSLVKKLALSSQPIRLNWVGGDLRKTALACWCELDAAGCRGH
jgi:hypothetical protein